VHTSGFEFGWTGLGRGCIGEVFGGVADSQGEEYSSSPISWASECAQIVLLGSLRGPYVLLVAFGAAGSSSTGRDAAASFVFGRGIVQPVDATRQVGFCE